VLLDTALALRKTVLLMSGRNYGPAQEYVDGFLQYFDQATLGMSDRIDPTERGLRQERDLLLRLLGTSSYYSGYYYY
jgi:hypothetical protein